MAANGKTLLVIGAAAGAAYLIHKYRKSGMSGIGKVDWDHALWTLEDMGIDIRKNYYELFPSQLVDVKHLAQRVGYRYNGDIPYDRAFWYALKRKAGYKY